MSSFRLSTALEGVERSISILKSSVGSEASAIMRVRAFESGRHTPYLATAVERTNLSTILLRRPPAEMIRLLADVGGGDTGGGDTGGGDTGGGDTGGGDTGGGDGGNTSPGGNGTADSATSPSGDASAAQSNSSAVESLSMMTSSYCNSESLFDAHSDDKTSTEGKLGAAIDAEESKSGFGDPSRVNNIGRQGTVHDMPTTLTTAASSTVSTSAMTPTDSPSSAIGTAPNANAQTTNGQADSMAYGQEPGLQSISGLTKTASAGLSLSTGIMTNLKAAGLIESSPHPVMKFSSKLLSASNAYDKSETPIEYAYEIGKSVVSSAAAKAASSAAVEAALATKNPYIAAGAGLAAAISTSLAFKYATSVVEETVGSATRDFSFYYMQLENEIKKLYGVSY